MNVELTRLHVSVNKMDFATLPRNGGEITVKNTLSATEIPDPPDWDRIRFIHGDSFKEYEFEGIDIEKKQITFHIGDLRLKT